MRGLSVIIPSRNAENLQVCMDAIHSFDAFANIVVIDDGIDWSLITFNKILYCMLEGSKPFIFSRNINIGIRETGDDDVVILNDDALLETASGFTAMQRMAEYHPEYGLLGPLTNVSGNREQTIKTGEELRETSRNLPFLCAFVPRSTIDKVGLLDERFTAYGWEDNDYCRRVRDAGLKVGIYEGCFVDHASLKSTFRGDPHTPGDTAEGREIYLQKWGSLV